jgi:leucyl-tRNA synthetase
VNGVSDDLENLRFNKAVARLYELTNTLQSALPAGEAPVDTGKGAALHEAAHFLVQLIAPMMPHLAEECWRVLGSQGLAAESAWPKAEASLLIDDEIVLPVQVNGRKRADLTIARSADNAAIEVQALALEAVQKALEGRAAKKVIIVPNRIVNVVG